MSCKPCFFCALFTVPGVTLCLPGCSCVPFLRMHYACVALTFCLSILSVSSFLQAHHCFSASSKLSQATRLQPAWQQPACCGPSTLQAWWRCRCLQVSGKGKVKPCIISWLVIMLNAGMATLFPSAPATILLMAAQGCLLAKCERTFQCCRCNRVAVFPLVQW